MMDKPQIILIFECVLVQSGLLSQNTREWAAYTQQKFIYHSSGGWEP